MAALGWLASTAAVAATGTFAPDGVPHAQYSPDQTDPAVPNEYFLGIFSGSTQGIYYYVASAICDALRARFEEHRIRCVPLRSQGAGSNRNLMGHGRAQMAIVQSDTNYLAASGETPIPGARSVLSLHNELGVLVVSRRAPLTRPADLPRHRVNLAPSDSVAHLLWLEYLHYLDLSPDDFKQALAFPQDINYDGLCNGDIDAFGIWTGHPVPALVNTLERCDASLVGMWDAKLEKLLADHPYYFRAELPAGMYPGQQRPLVSYGVKASLIAHEQTLPHIVYWLTRVLVEDVASLRTRHPALIDLDARQMHDVGNFLPFHPGAARYWREIGWDGEAPDPASASDAAQEQSETAADAAGTGGAR